MSDLGVTLAWLAVQVTLVLGPALCVQARVARRGPAAGAWVAALSLGLVVALSAWAFVPRPGRPAERAPTRVAAEAASDTGSAGADVGAGTKAKPGVTLDLAAVARAWARLGRGASAPAARCRPWGGVLGTLALAATGAGLLQLALGLWALRECRRRARAVDDPAMVALLDALRVAMGCRRQVALCAVDDLATPATAGWRRPLILLPNGWESWDDAERRAVLAHELAHVVRGDYAAGLLARAAVALHALHPLVYWMAARLQLQQELAADALGARHAGGRAGYLLALSRLALELEQDGRSPGWPARAFLPRRGALIRRIAMLRDETNGTGADGRAWRGLAAAGLLGLTAAVGLLRGPARADDKAPADAAVTRAKAAAPEASPAPLYLRDAMDGVIVIRPAAMERHAGVSLLVPFVDFLQVDLAAVAKELKVDTSRPGFLKLGVRDIEWVTGTIGIGRGKSGENDNLHSIMAGHPAIRTVAPFDWLAFLRQWRLELEEVRVEKGVYFNVKGPLAAHIGPNPSVYLPDDRTLILDDESTVRKLVGVPPASPAYLRNAEWDRASRGLLAIALKNEGGALAAGYDLGRPDDALVLSLFKNVDRWIFSVDDAEAITLNAAAACRNVDAGDALVRAIASLRKLGQDALERPAPPVAGPGAEADALALRMARSLLANLSVVRKESTVAVHAGGFGTLAEYAKVIEAQAMAAERDGDDESKRVKR